MKKSIKKTRKIRINNLMKGLSKITKHKLFKNKLYSSILMLVGFVSIFAFNGDCTAFIFTLMFGLPVFFAKENVIM